MTFDTEYELQQFRDVQSEYFDEEDKVYPNVNSQHACNRMLKLINSLESELKNNGVLADITLLLPSEEDIFNQATIHGKRIFDADLDTEKLDLIQSSMRFMRDIVIELNNKPTT